MDKVEIAPELVGHILEGLQKVTSDRSIVPAIEEIALNAAQSGVPAETLIEFFEKDPDNKITPVLGGLVTATIQDSMDFALEYTRLEPQEVMDSDGDETLPQVMVGILRRLVEYLPKTTDPTKTLDIFLSQEVIQAQKEGHHIGAVVWRLLRNPVFAETIVEALKRQIIPQIISKAYARIEEGEQAQERELKEDVKTWFSIISAPEPMTDRILRIVDEAFSRGINTPGKVAGLIEYLRTDPEIRQYIHDNFVNAITEAIELAYTGPQTSHPEKKLQKQDVLDAVVQRIPLLTQRDIAPAESGKRHRHGGTMYGLFSEDLDVRGTPKDELKKYALDQALVARIVSYILDVVVRDYDLQEYLLRNPGAKLGGPFKQEVIGLIGSDLAACTAAIMESPQIEYGHGDPLRERTMNGVAEKVVDIRRESLNLDEGQIKEGFESPATLRKLTEAMREIIRKHVGRMSLAKTESAVPFDTVAQAARTTLKSGIDAETRFDNYPLEHVIRIALPACRSQEDLARLQDALTDTPEGAECLKGLCEKLLKEMAGKVNQIAALQSGIRESVSTTIQEGVVTISITTEDGEQRLTLPAEELFVLKERGKVDRMREHVLLKALERRGLEGVIDNVRASIEAALADLKNKERTVFGRRKRNGKNGGNGDELKRRTRQPKAPIRAAAEKGPKKSARTRAERRPS